MNFMCRFLSYWLVIAMSFPASAQQMGGGAYMQAGTGMAGAVQGCPGGGMQIPPGARDALDDVRQRQKDLDALKVKIRRLESDKDKAESDRDRAKEDLGDIVDGRWVDTFASHIDNQNSCTSYSVHPSCSASAPSPSPEPAPAVLQKCPNGKCDKSPTKVDAVKKRGTASVDAAPCSLKTIRPVQADIWNRVCDESQPGNISAPAACESEIYLKGAEGRTRSKCISALQKYQNAAAKVRKLDNQLAVYGEDRLDRASDRVDSAKRRFEEAITR